METDKQERIEKALHSVEGQESIAKAVGESYAREHGEVAGKMREKEMLRVLRISATYDALMKRM